MESNLLNNTNNHNTINHNNNKSTTNMPITTMLNNIMQQFKTDISNERDAKCNELAERHTKLANAIKTEEDKVDTAKSEIDLLKEKLHQHNIKYLLQKIKYAKHIETADINIKKYQDLIKINIVSTIDDKDKIKKYTQQIDTENQILNNKIRDEDIILQNETNIFNLEKTRINQKQENINQELQKQIQLCSNDINDINTRIQDTKNNIEHEQEEINQIENGNNMTRRQIIKNNNIYLHRKKNFKKIKNNLQYQLANLNIELYQLDIDFKNEYNSTQEKHNQEYTNARNIIKTLNDEYNLFANAVSTSENNAKNKSSKTWQLSHQDKITKMEDSQILLTEEIQSYNMLMTRHKEELKQIEYNYNQTKEIKQNEYNNIQTKINKLNQGENNQLNRFAQKQHINRKFINQKMEHLNKLNTQLSLLEQEKSNYQTLINTYKTQTDNQLSNLQYDMDRANKRMDTIYSRFNNNTNEHRQSFDINISKYQTLILEHTRTLEQTNNIIKQLEIQIQNTEKDKRNNNYQIWNDKKEIKELDRLIKDKEKQLQNIIKNVNKRIDIIKEKEKDLIGMRTSNDIEYLIKLKEINNIQNQEINTSEPIDNDIQFIDDELLL
jgi:hypothetical protein